MATAHMVEEHVVGMYIRGECVTCAAETWSLINDCTVGGVAID